MPAKHTRPAVFPPARPAPRAPQAASATQQRRLIIQNWMATNETHTFGTAQVCRLVQGVTPRMLQWLDDRHYFSPTIHRHARRYTIEDALMLGIVFNLRGRGFSLAAVRRLIKPIEYRIRRIYLLADQREQRGFIYPDYLLVTTAEFKTRPADVCAFHEEDVPQCISRLASNGRERCVIVDVNLIADRIYAGAAVEHQKGQR